MFLVPATLVVLACSVGEATPTVPPTSTATPTPVPTHTAAPTGPDSNELRVQIISSELTVGTNRLVFAILDRDLVLGAEAELSTFYPGGVPQVVDAPFRKWPLGNVGVYTAIVDFDRNGTWGFKVEVSGEGNFTRSATGQFMVKEEGSTPRIGSHAPPSKNKTVRDVNSLEELTSAPEPDPDLYSMTIAEAISSGKPLLVVFATPLFCSTATCGPQLEVIEEVKDGYKDRVNFIHVEVFDNPHEIEGDRGNARAAPAVEEWGLGTEPWTFIVDSYGLVAAKFEAFTTREEIEEHLDLLLRE